MKTLLIVAYLLAAAAVVRSEDRGLLKKYLEYLVPYLNPCAEEFELTDEEAHNVQPIGDTADVSKMGCVRACVMKRMDALKGVDVQLGPIVTMIESVHAGYPEEIEEVKKIAANCIEITKGLTNECDIGMQYADCYIKKLFDQ